MARDVTPPVDGRPTLGLCVITERLDTDLRLKLRRYLEHDYVDEVYIGINGGEKATSRELTIFQYTPVRLADGSFADFAGARNALTSEVKTDYWTWMDTDDTIEDAANLRRVVEYMEHEGVEIVKAPYYYAFDAQGNVSELQNRERVIKTSAPGSWHGAVHETWIPEMGAESVTTRIVRWVHTKDKADHRASMLRNRKILEAEYAHEPRDPRIAYYLGLNLGQDQHYAEAIECFRELIRTGGWDEERYRAWLQIFSCYFELGNYEAAAQAALSATLELPEWPDAYYLLQQVYYQIDDHEKSLEWFKIARAKPEPLSDSAYNPTVRHTQPLYLAAFSALSTGQVDDAAKYGEALEKLDPEYPGLAKLKPHIIEALAAGQAVKAVKLLTAYYETHEGDPEGLLKTLPTALRADVRLTEERRRYIPGVKWPKHSIVFFCGSSYEPWGPEYLDKGMGGSEEAVIYLARELATQGRVVTVYNNRSEEYSDHSPRELRYPVVYKPWTEINPADEYDVFVAWRSPEGLENIKARRKLVDLHDIIDADLVYRYARYVDKYLFKSQFHRNLYPELPDAKCVVIGNGIPKEQFA
jgi:tetratricopeptide (TPR) repeat protein